MTNNWRHIYPPNQMGNEEETEPNEALKELMKDSQELIQNERYQPQGTTNTVYSPGYYAQGIETWDYISSHNMDFLQGNVIKYITRFRKKNGLEDLRKAKAYLDKLIETEYPGEVLGK